MKTARKIRSWPIAGAVLALSSFWLLAAVAAEPKAGAEGQPAKADDRTPEKLRAVRVAVFDVDVLPGVGVEGPAVTNQVNTILSALPQVTLVNRDQIKKVAEEHQIALSGLVDNSSAVKLGKFLSAEYIVVGRASKIGQTFYLVLKIVDVETTEQTTVSAKAPAESGFSAVLQRLGEPLAANIRRLQRPGAEPADTALAELRSLAQPIVGKVILVLGRGEPRRPAAAGPGRADGHRPAAPQPGPHGDRAQGPRRRLEGIAPADRQVRREEGRFPP